MNPNRWAGAVGRCLFSYLLLLALGVSQTSFGAVRITEFLAENDGGLRDADGDSPDWIELFNDTPVAVDLAGWRLTEDVYFHANGERVLARVQKAVVEALRHATREP